MEYEWLTSVLKSLEYLFLNFTWTLHLIVYYCAYKIGLDSPNPNNCNKMREDCERHTPICVPSTSILVSADSIHENKLCSAYEIKIKKLLEQTPRRLNNRKQIIKPKRITKFLTSTPITKSPVSKKTNSSSQMSSFGDDVSNSTESISKDSDNEKLTSTNAAIIRCTLSKGNTVLKVKQTSKSTSSNSTSESVLDAIAKRSSKILPLKRSELKKGLRL